MKALMKKALALFQQKGAIGGNVLRRTADVREERALLAVVLDHLDGYAEYTEMQDNQGWWAQSSFSDADGQDSRASSAQSGH